MTEAPQYGKLFLLLHEADVAVTAKTPPLMIMPK